MATMGVSYRLRDNRDDFSRKSQIFPTPVYFAPKLTGSPWNWVLALGVRKTKMMALPGRKKNMFDDIFSHLDTIRERGGQTPADSKDRANAYTRGKHNVNFCTRTIIPGYGIIRKRIRLNKWC